MDNDRRLRLWQRIVDDAQGGTVTVDDACGVMLSAAAVDAVAVTVVLEARPRETVFASDKLAADIEELTLVLGEGPGHDAFTESPALIADLAEADCQTRWPIFAPSAVEAGVRALFALPLRLGGVAVGVLCLYRAEPGDLSREQLADALLLADTVMALLLDAAHKGSPASDSRWSEGVGPQHPEVHQATGMITVQSGVSAAVALVRLRAYAYAEERRLSEVARDVVARRLRFDGSES